MRFVFQNNQEVEVELLIEPWAISEIVSPGEVVEFEVNDSPAPEIEFYVVESGQPCVYVMSELVRIRANGQEHVFRTEKRPPLAGFHFLRPIFHSN